MRPQPFILDPEVEHHWRPPAIRESVRIAVERTLNKTLTSTEARVMRLRYGIGVRPCRVSEIAHRLGVRVTTVLRLHARALRKLRATAFPGSTVLSKSPPPASHQPSGCPPSRPARGTPP